MIQISLFRTLVSLLAVVGVLVLSPIAQAEVTSDSLDGKTFAGHIGEKGKTKALYDEEMSFKGGKMVSSACATLGFSSFPYKTTAKGDVIEFAAKATNPTKGTLKWKGVIKGDKLKATSVLTKPGEAPDETWLKAKLKK